MIKAGWATIQFNAFLQEKTTTQVLRGGNSEEFYDKEGTLPKSQMLVDVHPDVSELVYKFNRIHHHVAYKKLKPVRLKRKKGLEIQSGVNNYGMSLQTRTQTNARRGESYAEI